MRVYCAQCLQPFAANKENAVYCSPSCRQMAYRDRTRMFRGYVDLYPLCLHCGKRMFQLRSGRQKKYCSASCRTMAYRKRRKPEKQVKRNRN